MIADKPRLEPMQCDKVLVLVTALEGALLVNVSGQAFGTGIVEIQGGIGVSAGRLESRHVRPGTAPIQNS